MAAQLTMKALAADLAEALARIEMLERQLAAAPAPVLSFDGSAEAPQPSVPLPPAVKRVVRTVFQVLAALIVAVPAAAASFNLSESTTAKVAGVVGALTALASVLHNALDPFLPSAMRRDAPPTDVESCTT